MHEYSKTEIDFYGYREQITGYQWGEGTKYEPAFKPMQGNPAFF